METPRFPPILPVPPPGSREFNPRAYHVFGPKLIATRGFFDDAALESRFLTEEMEAIHLREDIPISLPPEHEQEAQRLRNQLLLYRFRNYSKPRALSARLDRSLEPRLAQIFAPLLAIAEDEETVNDLRTLATSYHNELRTDRGLDLEADLLSLLVECWSQGKPPTVNDIAGRLMIRSPQDHVTTKRVGWLIRKRLRLETVRTRDGYVVTKPDEEYLKRLLGRYGMPGDTLPELSSPSSRSSPKFFSLNRAASFLKPNRDSMIFNRFCFLLVGALLQ